MLCRSDTQAASGKPSVKSASMDQAGFGRHFAPVSGHPAQFNWQTSLPPRLDLSFSAPSQQQQWQPPPPPQQQQQQRRPLALSHKFGSLSLTDAERDAAFGSLSLSATERDTLFPPAGLVSALREPQSNSALQIAPE